MELMELMERKERVKELLEHSLWGLRGELGRQERQESVLLQVQGLMELSRMKMKPWALLWAWRVSGSLYSCNVTEFDNIP